MANQAPNSRYTELLDELQLQSWQLELVISGFAIFGLFSALEPLFDWFIQLTNLGLFRLRYFVYAVYFSCILTIINLIIHVLLRGLWIGAVGLRSVSGEIDFSELNFNSKITNYLKGKIGSFDDYIERLETYSSIIFGLTFLIVFIVIGVFINFVLFLYITSLPFKLGLGETAEMIVFTILCLLLITTFIFIFIDFVTRGWLKKKSGKWYLPFYRLTSILTLSAIYRPLLYNFWDNKFGRKLIIWLLPIYLISIFVFGSRYISTHYLSNYYDSSLNIASRRNYWDTVKNTGDYIGYAAIPSKTITKNYLEVSIPYESFLEEMMFKYDSTLIPKKSRVGLKNIVFEYFHWSLGVEVPLDKELDYLNKLNDMLILQIDSLAIEEPFIISKEYDNETSLKNFIDISNLEQGKHLLTIQRRTSKTDSTKTEHYETIPFWYFPD